MLSALKCIKPISMANQIGSIPLYTWSFFICWKLRPVILFHRFHKMKEPSTAPSTRKNLGQSLRKSAIVLGSRISSCVSKRSETEKRSSRPSVRLIDANGLDLTPLPLLSEDKRVKEERELVGSCAFNSHSH